MSSRWIVLLLQRSELEVQMCIIYVKNEMNGIIFFFLVCWSVMDSRYRGGGLLGKDDKRSLKVRFWKRVFHFNGYGEIYIIATI